MTTQTPAATMTDMRRTATSALAGLRQHWPLLILAAGFLALFVPTIIGISRVSWSSEEGAHGPIVLTIAVWLLIRSWPGMVAAGGPGSAVIGAAGLAGSLLVYVAAHVVGSITIESFGLYAALLATLYLMVGARGMARGWFAVFYFVFVLPPPGRIVAAATQPLRLGLSEVAVNLLASLHYPVARAGLTIYVGQYELLVKAACSGLNSMISLSAIGLFYVYARHNANWRYCCVMLAAIIGMAIVANFARIITLIMITYYLGAAAAEGFLHQTAGLLMFAIAIGGVILIDHLARPLRERLARETVA
jgi:exosortase